MKVFKVTVGQMSKKGNLINTEDLFIKSENHTNVTLQQAMQKKYRPFCVQVSEVLDIEKEEPVDKNIIKPVEIKLPLSGNESDELKNLLELETIAVSNLRKFENKMIKKYLDPIQTQLQNKKVKNVHSSSSMYVTGTPNYYNTSDYITI